MTRACGVLAFGIALAACSSVKVQTEYDKAANYKGYKTYAWLPRPPGPEQAEAARDPRIREAVIRGIDGGLASKGLVRTDPDKNPDLLVAVHGWAVNRIDVQTYGYGYGAVPYGFYPTLATTTVDVHQYRDGTLLIDLIDGPTKQLVWRGTATDTFDPGTEASTVSKAISATLKEYPPRQ
ncbi:MAG: DUF4136 domain-containing protein [Myxococcales bacterium]|jgi:hypothetical protein